MRRRSRKYFDNLKFDNDWRSVKHEEYGPLIDSFFPTWQNIHRLGLVVSVFIIKTVGLLSILLKKYEDTD